MHSISGTPCNENKNQETQSPFSQFYTKQLSPTKIRDINKRPYGILLTSEAQKHQQTDRRKQQDPSGLYIVNLRKGFTRNKVCLLNTIMLVSTESTNANFSIKHNYLLNQKSLLRQKLHWSRNFPNWFTLKITPESLKGLEALLVCSCLLITYKH